MMFKIILLGMAFFLQFARWRSAELRQHLKGKTLTDQLCTADRKTGMTS